MSIANFPDEIIQHVLYYITPEDNLLNVQPVSKRLYRLANEGLLWRHHCLTSFAYWAPEHDSPHLFQRLRVADVRWKDLYLLRRRRNARVSRLLDEIVAGSTGRIRKFEQICELGYDAKDFLLDQIRHTDDGAEDVLARRYFAKAVLDSIHRSLALAEWAKMNPNLDINGGQGHGPAYAPSRFLERVLGGFDLFLIHDQPGDLDDISQLLDERVSEFRREHPNLDDMTIRNKALTLNHWLRANDLVGMHNADQRYRNLRNCLIGHALQEDDHSSLPIISAAIFCVMAERIGLNARCCMFPTHVHAIVVAPLGRTLDESSAQPGPGPVEGSTPYDDQKMYLDPFGNDGEVLEKDLRAIASRIGWLGSIDRALVPVPPSAVALRTAYNIRATYNQHTGPNEERYDPALTALRSGDDGMNMTTAFYAALWVFILVGPHQAQDWFHAVRNILSQFENYWPEDAWLVQKYILPSAAVFGRAPVSEDLRWANPISTLSYVYEHDRCPLVCSRKRIASTGLRPSWRVGEVALHRRHEVLVIVVGWHVHHAGMNHEMRAVHRVLLPREAKVMSVAGDSLSPVPESYSPDDMNPDSYPNAGRYFKRFDKAAWPRPFVSNMEDRFPDEDYEYPEDDD